MKFKAEKSFFYNVIIAAVPVFLFFFICGCPSPVPPQQPPDYPKPYKVGSEWYQPIPSAHDFRQSGIASWYGKKFHGRKTSNGETYDMYAMTAAHKTLPHGTWVRVTNKKNNREAVVRVNDRGPFVSGRIIDLSYTAAKHIDIVGLGTAPVEIIALGRSKDKKAQKGIHRSYQPVNFYSGNFTFQVGAFKDRSNAERLRQRLAGDYRNAHITTWNNGEETYYRVRVGKYQNLQEIIKDESVLIKQGFTDVFIVAE